MTNQAMRRALLALIFPMMCAPVHAATWQICRLELRIIEVVRQPYPQLQAQVLEVSRKSPATECPEEGSSLTFTPETPDYQATLPRKQWPGRGQSVRVDYRYLDGICKGDGNNYPCRIRHYPVVGR
ncbi:MULTISPECIES: hypothetical protein [unclassified Pseudomonas]|uniref:hypothetical protein n=2 Tax=Pseudomonas TaxID=286 RepID=UPI001199D19E|nr:MULTISPECIES: hypothetical protein [unclassified Pseudomonas]TWC15328.1 hypothetical protein FBX99_1235 [Pseudomonas sp. SJZ074]TWC14557.1 hypothetical protein FBY00_11757 [Pseudomonas sp. SJZ075]TWC30975.1 hypothetical protein FBY02_11657 [Pseudomonas sp. SJZ078]TWC33732.1 hypothetical protein FBY06_12391 [Pseudomonas sp. SJZ085]TWC51921.1 hypothetical protein FBY11_11649 [Pseudomonas sp. SJZ124]